jgi:hypothetical protein
MHRYAQKSAVGLIIVLAIVGVGLIALNLTRAAGAYVTAEAESGTATSPAVSGSDTTASGGRYVSFRQPTSFVFTAAGDHDNNSNSVASMDKVKASGSNFYLALGDLSYEAGGEQAWCNMFKSRFNHVEILAGNHDVGESAGGNINNYIQYCPYTLNSILTGSYGKQYYFDYPATNPIARFIMIAPDVAGSLNINYTTTSSAGYVFTKNAIDDAQADGIKWIIVGMHKNCISTGSKSCEIGTTIMNLLINERVDLILQSHDHNYQRSHALSCITTNTVNSACIGDSGSDNLYIKGRGPVIVINGEFGRPLYDVAWADSESGYFAAISSTSFGLSKYTVTNTQITSEYLKSSSTGTWSDTFTIRQ